MIKKVAVQMKRVGPVSPRFAAKQAAKKTSVVRAGSKSKLPPKLVAFQASQGHVLPIFYQGKIIQIVSSAPTVLDMNQLSYQSKAHLRRALKMKGIVQVPVPAQATTPTPVPVGTLQAAPASATPVSQPAASAKEGAQK